MDLWGLGDYSYFSIEDSDDDIVKLSPLTKFFYGVGCYAGALVVSGVTIFEDVITFGAGIADAPISAVGVGALFLTGNAFFSSAFNDISAEISTNYVRSDYSKGKKVRDKEGNPIPLDQQSPGPLGKGANARPENIGDPGDLGGPNFKSPKTFLGKIVVFFSFCRFNISKYERFKTNTHSCS